MNALQIAAHDWTRHWLFTVRTWLAMCGIGRFSSIVTAQSWRLEDVMSITIEASAPIGGKRSGFHVSSASKWTERFHLQDV